MTDLALTDRPFYRERMTGAGLPAPWDLDDLQRFAARHGDPYGGRLRPGERPPVALQIESSEDHAVWVGLDARELRTWSRALEAAWRRWGVSWGETIAFFDYGSSPTVLLASGAYLPYLGRGAADRLGLSVICNDGVPSLAGRMAEVLALVRPAALVVRRDCLSPLAQTVRTQGPEVSGILRWVAVCEPEGAPRLQDVAPYAADWSVPVRRLLRFDAALFLAGDCDRCGAFHVDPRLYRLEGLPDGGAAVTTRFARTCTAVRYRLDRGEVLGPGCPAEPRAWRVRWP